MSERTGSGAARRYEPGPLSGLHLRVGLGYLLAPFLPGLMIWLLLILLGQDDGPVGRPNGLVLILYVTGWFTVPATLICGIPADIFCHRRGWCGWWVYGTGGAIIGGAIALLFLAPDFGQAETLTVACSFAACGAVSAIGLWAVAYASPRVGCLTLLTPMTLLVLAALVRLLPAA